MNEERQQDRIMHLLLAEGLGQQTPPDLRARIMDRAFPSPSIVVPAPVAEMPLEESIPEPVRIIPIKTPAKVAAEAAPTTTNGSAKKTARRPLIFRLARPLAAAAMLLFVIGLFMYVNRPYPAPQVAGEFTTDTGQAPARGTTIITSDRTARITLGASYQLDMAPLTRVKIEGAPGAEAVTLLEGELTCDAPGNLHDLEVKTEFGTIHAADAHFRATLQTPKSLPTVGRGENSMNVRKLVVVALTGVLSVTGPWGETSFGAGQQQAFAAAGPVTPAATPAGSTANTTRIAGTITSISNDQLTVGTVVVSVGGNVSVKLSDKPATLADLKAGMNVVIYITGETTQIIASAPAAPKPPAAINITGMIAALGNGEISIKSSTKTTGVLVTDSTVYKIKDVVSTFGDLKVGMSVLAITTDGKTATEVRAYVPTMPPATTNISGTLAAIGDGQLTIKTANALVPVTLTNTTVIKVNGTVATLADLQTGWSIMAITTDGKTATEIRAYKPTATTVTGTIVSAADGHISIHTSSATVDVSVNDKTIIRIKDALGSFADLKAGMNIQAAINGDKVAVEIHAYTPTPTPPPATTIGGILTAIGNGQVTITDGAKNTVVLVTDATTFNVNGAAATADALKTGMRIYATTTDGKTATVLRAYTPTPTSTPLPSTTTTLTGVLSQLSATQVGIQGNGKTTILAVNDATVFKLNGKVVGRGDLKTGLSVAVLTTDNKTATEVRAYSTTTTAPVAANTITGTIAQVAGNQVTIKTATASIVITLADTTIIRVKDALATAADLKVGMYLSAAVGDGHVAKEIHAYVPTSTTTPR